MNRNATIRLVIVAFCICLFSSMGYTQGDNNPDPLINLALIDGAIVTGSVPNDQARGIPEDILWDPSTNDWATVSDLHEYGMAFGDIMAATKNDPLYWQVVWTEPKNINYITCAGTYPNQPQPTTGWAVQIMVDGNWQVLAKAHDGWDEDSLKGTGEWVDDGLLEWRGLEPIVSNGLRFIAYANPDSLDDGLETFSDSLWSFACQGRSFGDGTPKAALIQYLDYSEATATNEKDESVNLALLDEAIVSSNLTPKNHPDGRGQPADMLWDPRTGDFNNIHTSWGEFGYDYGFDAGVTPYDSAFYWMAEFPVPMNINYFTWGGVYGAQAPQRDTYWAVEYCDNDVWVELASGIGTDRETGTWLYDSQGNQYAFAGMGVDSTTNSTWQSEEPVQTTKFRLAVWDPNYSLWSFHLRGRGGQTKNWDERIWVRGYDPEGWMVIDAGADPIPSTFKAILLQYRDVTVDAIQSDNQVPPAEFALHQNYPNPFNPVTMINYQLPMINDVELNIYNLIGKKVAALVSERQSAGSYQVEWDATGLASGFYFYRIESCEFVDIKKMILIK